ncbi:hypothetical protein V1514DRAFT_335574 [Lipomyces japonicus]|uniref:uncharacterized protein n=1 Tax=Lipomyces japonicus TaxID=56871 RepID=UPI0034CF78C5
MPPRLPCGVTITFRFSCFILFYMPIKAAAAWAEDLKTIARSRRVTVTRHRVPGKHINRSMKRRIPYYTSRHASSIEPAHVNTI